MKQRKSPFVTSRSSKSKDLAGFVELVPGGKHAYLWIGRSASDAPVVIDGANRLRRLAQAILDEVPASPGTLRGRKPRAR